MKSTSNPSVGPKIDLSKLSEEQLTVLFTNTQKALKDAADRKAADQAQKDHINKMAAATVDSFHISLGKALGQPMTPKEALAYYASYLETARPVVSTSKTKSRNRSKTPATTSTSADKGKRLNDTERNAIRSDMLNRAINQRLSKTYDTISAIADRHGVTAQTVDKYKASADQIKAELDRLVPATTPAVQAQVAATA